MAYSKVINTIGTGSQAAIRLRLGSWIIVSAERNSEGELTWWQHHRYEGRTPCRVNTYEHSHFRLLNHIPA